jgi:hypothetical protein
MMFAEGILRWAGTALQVPATVLGVTQIALGMQIILQSMEMLGILMDPTGWWGILPANLLRLPSKEYFV